ncbi:unnamed protein product [Cuscuta epithymum]|uniref:Uncharacterized protein n=1 Tax=Cuscuta epithymum TaxID=186058 RepID=A0AAV0DRB5_9ASTE|nr:unnamed protein product [Cuscuta epithymum]
MSEKALETQWHRGRKPQSKHRETLAGPEKKKVSILKVIKHCWTKHGDESEVDLPPRLTEIETKYNTNVEKKRAELGLTQEDEIDSDVEDDAITEAAGVCKGRVPCMGAERQRILYDRSGSEASSSRSRRREDPRIAQMQREVEEQQRALEQQQKEEETSARLEAMERILNVGYQPPPQPHPRPYILHPEQTSQVPYMGNMGYHSNSGYGSMPTMGPTFGSLSYDFLNQFQSSGGRSRGASRGPSRGGSGGGS